MPNIRTFESPVDTLQPTERGSAAFRELGNLQERNARAEQAEMDRAGRAFGQGIAAIGNAFGNLFEQQQQHTDTVAELEATKNATQNDLNTLDAIEGRGTKATTDDDGNPTEPTLTGYRSGVSDVLSDYEKTQAAEREQFAASGASQKAQDRFALQQATRMRSIMIKAHTEEHAVATQEALGNVDKSVNTSISLIDRHPEMLDDELGRFDQTMGTVTAGMGRLEAKETLGAKSVEAKGTLIGSAILSYARSGQLDQVDRILNNQKYDQYIGKEREQIESKVSSITQARIKDQNAKDKADADAIGAQQDDLVDQIYRNTRLPPEQQNPDLTRAALETSPLFRGRPADLEKARKTLDSLTNSTIDPAQSKQIADGVSRGITAGTVTSAAQIDQAYNTGRMTWADRTRLQTELKDAQDNPATKAFNSDVNDWLKRNEGQIDAGFAQTGAAGRSELGQQMVTRWEQEVKRRAQIIRQKGGDPHELLDPNSPNSMVTPQALAPFRVTDAMNAQFQANRKAQDQTIETQRAAGQTPTGAVPVPQPLQGIQGLARNPATGQFYDPAKKLFYNADGTPAKMSLQPPKATPAPQPQKMNFAPDEQGSPAQNAINAAMQPMPDAHLDKNLFSSGRAQAMGIRGGVGQNLTTISVAGKNVTVNAAAAPHFKAFLEDLTSRGYKIDDIGGYSDRLKRGSFASMSEHAYGNAIDINPDRNPFHSRKTDLPPNVAQIAAKYGLIWGGNWSGNSADPMHFEWSGKGGATVFASR
jgi:hypothetical protein